MARPSKPWYWAQRDCWCVTIGGKRHILAQGKASKGEATAEFHRLMVASGRQEVRKSALTVGDLLDLFLEDVWRAVEQGERARVTYDGYVRFLSSANERLGRLRATDVRPHDVKGWFNAPELRWGPTTRHNAATAFKAAFRWAKKGGLIPEDPVRDMDKPTARRRILVLTDDQVRALLDATPDRPWKDLITALWETGCRPSEVCTLTAAQVDLDRGLWLVRNKTRRKTGRESRPVPLNPTMLEISRRLVTAHPDGPIFRNRRGRPWTRNAMALRFRALRMRLGLGPEATGYAIRHRYAMEGIRKGLSSSELAALMGHTNAAMVDKVYGHWDQQHERLKEAARKIRPGDANGPPASDDAGT